MQRSKHLALMFLLGAVLVGGALGFTADRVWMKESSCNDPRRCKALLYDRLELTAAQRAAWDSIRSRGRAQIRALLTPTQLERFEAILREPKANDKRENPK